MAAFAKLAFTPTTMKLHFFFNGFNLKLPLTQFTQLPLWFALTVTQAAVIFQPKISVWPGQVHSTPLPLPHLLIVPMAQGAQVGGKKGQTAAIRE